MGQLVNNTAPVSKKDRENLLNLLAWRHWLAGLATDIRAQKMKYEEAIAKIDNAVKNLSQAQKDEIYASFDYLLLVIPTPHNAIANVMEYASGLYDRYGNQMHFPSFLQRAHHKLFIAVLILGAGGRAFIFARNAVGKTVGLGPMSVQRFLQSLILRKLVVCVRKGIQFKQASWYRLCTEEMANAWLNIGRFLNVDDAPETETTIRQKFVWMFDGSNEMNYRPQTLGS